MKTHFSVILMGLLLICKVAFTQKSDKPHFVGELIGGGIVFYVEDNGKHGLIASLKDIMTNTPWAAKQEPTKPFPSKPTYGINVTTRTFSSDIDGLYNTKMIIQSGYAKSAAWYCSIYSSDSNHDWYLPSIDELKKLIASKSIIDPILNGIKAKGAEGLSDKYWSSTNTDIQPTGTWAYNTAFKLANMHDNFLNVRAIRKF
jgi:hypothetical protein